MAPGRSRLAGDPTVSSDHEIEADPLGGLVLLCGGYDVAHCETDTIPALLNESRDNRAVPPITKQGVVSVPRWAARITAARQKLGFNQTEFAKKLNVTQSNVSKWEKGTNRPVPDAFVRIAGLTDGLDKFYFLEEAGIPKSYFIDEAVQAVPSKVAEAMDRVVTEAMTGIAENASIPRIDMVFIPLLADAVAAGNPRTINERDIEQVIPMPTSWLPSRSKLYAVRVDGDSMDPVLKDGDIVVIDTSKQNAKKLVDHMVAARVGEGVTIKYLRSDGVHLMLVPQHTSVRHPIKILTADQEDWNIVGEVVKCISDPPKPKRR